MKKGELWVVELPAVGGHEQHGTRPVIVIADTTSTVAIIIPCTSNLQALRLPHTIQLKPTERNGLDGPSIALVLQLRVIDKRRLQAKIGSVERKVLSEIDDKLRELLGL